MSLLLLFVLSSGGSSITTTGSVCPPHVVVRLRQRGHKTADRTGEQMEHIHIVHVYMCSACGGMIYGQYQDVFVCIISICEERKHFVMAENHG